MKTLLLMFLLFGSYVQTFGQSFELRTNTDTVNMTDAHHKKQGKWMFRGYNGVKSPCSESHRIFESGMYKDNLRVGTWSEYYCNGNIKRNITYLNGKPDGITSYHLNGKISIEGHWKDGHWVNKYRSFDEKGNLINECNFNEKGENLTLMSVKPKK